MKLIDPSKGQPHWGVIAMPVDCVNYQDFDLRSMMDAPLPRWRRRWAFNQFQFYGVMGPDWVAGIAWVDLKLVANCFYYVYDFRTQRMHEASWLQPFALGSHMDVTPDRGQARFRQPGVEALMQVVNGRREIRVKDRRGVSLALDIEEPAPASVLRVCSPSGYGRWAYTQKMAGLPVRG
ncbi:MAG: DUF2804 family protein, partial [Gammaproteobacteria bacterium]|nr:DUF2804 family protein [Gammaproteobacteria bacterium]